MTVKTETVTENVGRFRVVATKHVVGGPWWVKVYRQSDDAEFSLQRFSYASAEEAMTVGRAWVADAMAHNSEVAA